MNNDDHREDSRDSAGLISRRKLLGGMAAGGAAIALGSGGRSCGWSHRAR